MLCQNCNQNLASMHFKQTINGQTQEIHLCPACAQKMGVQQSFEKSFQNSFANFGKSWFSDDPFFALPFGGQIAGERQCKTCGMTQSELQRTGRAGCAQCYDIFEDILTPYIRKLQGASAHIGSSPANQEENTDTLKNRLKQAISQENYEEAARLRDEIRRLEEEHHA